VVGATVWRGADGDEKKLYVGIAMHLLIKSCRTQARWFRGLKRGEGY